MNCCAAACYATISASFTIEQLGLPKMTSGGRLGKTTGREEWNGDDPRRRLQFLKARGVDA